MNVQDGLTWACKKILDFLMLYDCKTFEASSGSPVLKEVNGKLQVVGIHRGPLRETYYNSSTHFSDILNYIDSNDKKVPEFTRQCLRDFAGKIKWKEVKMIDLLVTLQPLAADWKEFAFNLIKMKQTELRGIVRTIEGDCYHDTTANNALSEVVHKWLVRTKEKDRTWQTLLDVAEMLNEHKMLKYLEEKNISKDNEPEMRDVNGWCRVSTCRSDWYKFASALLPKEEARAIEGNLRGDGSKECLRRVLSQWLDYTVDPTWGMVVDALQPLPEATVVVEKILDNYKFKL